MTCPVDLYCPFCETLMTCEILIDQQTMIMFEAQQKINNREASIQGHLPKIFLNKKRVCTNCNFVALFGT